MNKLIQKMEAWVMSHKEREQAARKKTKQERLETESKRRLQVMEYEGEVYLSYDGVPLLSERDFGSDMISILESMRSNWKKYEMTKQE